MRHGSLATSSAHRRTAIARNVALVAGMVAAAGAAAGAAAHPELLTRESAACSSGSTSGRRRSGEPSRSSPRVAQFGGVHPWRCGSAEGGEWVRILKGMKTLLRIGAGVCLTAGAYALFVRPRMLRWGATQDEVRERFPGADIIPDGKRSSTMAVTLDAPPSSVWPWLVQMGYDRAGWYSWDRLDLFGRASARRLHPEWQSLSVGQRLLATPDGKHWFEVAALEAARFLALRVFTSGGRQYDAAGPRPRSFTDSLWAFELKELPGGRTRLIVSVHAASRPRLFSAVIGFLFWEPAHFVMQTRQFANLKRRAEGTLREARREHWIRPSDEMPTAPQPQD